jgi:hypothetical protein
LALESESVVAGVEIAFKQSDGLEYLRFEPAAGVENPIKAAAKGNTWVGFFSATNKYRPAGGVLNFGALVFRYTGNSAEQVTIAETRLHSLTGAGSAVESVRGKPGTVIPVTRETSTSSGDGIDPADDEPTVVPTTPPGSDTDKPSGNNSGNNSNSASGSANAVSTAGRSNSSSATGGTGATGSSSQTTNGSTAALETGAAQEVPDAPVMVPFSTPEKIADSDIPLAGAPEGSADKRGGLLSWQIVASILAFAVLTSAFAFFVIWKRRRGNADKNEVMKNTHVSNR